MIAISNLELENSQEEWKEIWDPSHLRAIVAFHDTNGGRMIIGRRDDGSYAGLKDPKDVAKKVSDTIHNKLHINVDVHIEEFDGLKCVVVDVPPGKNMTSLDGRFYTRVGNTDQELEGDELKSAILGDKGVPWMDQICKFTKEDLSEDSIEFFIKNGKKHGRISDSVDPKDIDGVLSSYDLVIDGKLTLTAGILFGKKPRRLNDGAFLKIGEFDEHNVLRRENYVEVPGIQIPEETIRILYERYIQPRFGYGGLTAMRSLVDLYPRDALRELLVNAVVHKDYRLQEPITVAVYPDRIEISCYGGLPTGWVTDDLFEKHISVRRNRTLATVFHDAGFVENWGQGIEKVVAACNSNRNPSPEFYVATGALYAVIYKREKIDNNEVTQDVVDVPEVVESPEVTEEQGAIDTIDVAGQIIGLIIDDPRISITEMARTLSMSKRNVERYTSKLVLEGKIRREGSARTGKWVILDGGV